MLARFESYEQEEEDEKDFSLHTLSVTQKQIIFCFAQHLRISDIINYGDNGKAKWLDENEIPFVLVFTKGDKLGKTMLLKNIEENKLEMIKQWEELPEIFITSAEKKTGLNEITTYIERLNPQFQEII